MRFLKFREYVRAKEGILLLDRPLSPVNLKAVITPGSPRLPSRSHHDLFTAQPLPSVGAYVLYDRAGRLLYTGKSRHLRDTIVGHFADSEDNPLIRNQVRSFIVYPTRTVRRAEEMEGELFDAYVRLTGKYPPANRHRPPGSCISDDEIVRIRLSREHAR